MEHSEKQTGIELIGSALTKSGWKWKREVRLGPNEASSRMYVDYLLTFRNITMAVLEVKAEFRSAAEGMRQASQFANQLFLRFSISTNGHDWILTDNTIRSFETLSSPPSPEELIKRAGWSIDWARWSDILSSSYLGKTPLHVQQDIAIQHTLMHFAQGNRRAQISMVAGSGKSQVSLQIVWKYLKENTAQRRILFLTDRKILNQQLFELFGSFPYIDRQIIEFNLTKNDKLKSAKVYFSTIQHLFIKENEKALFLNFPPDFFDLIVLNDISESLHEQPYNLLRYFSDALQLRISNGLDIEKKDGEILSYSERANEYFGPLVFAYTSTQAVVDGYLVPDHIIQRQPNHKGKGYTFSERALTIEPDQKHRSHMHSRTRELVEDLWHLLGERKARDEKTVIFSSDITHASLMTSELQRLSNNPDYVACLTSAQENAGAIFNTFSRVGNSYPRVIVVVDMFVGLDVPDIENVVFARYISNILTYRQMKSIGSRPCPKIGKTQLTIYDYSGATLLEEGLQESLSSEHRKGLTTGNWLSPSKEATFTRDSLWELSSSASIIGNEVHISDGRILGVIQYLDFTKTAIQQACHNDVDELYHLWSSKETRTSLRNQLHNQDISIPALRRYFQLTDSDDVDILAKIGFQLSEIPTRAQRVENILETKSEWLRETIDPQQAEFLTKFWQAVLDHYSHSGIDELEQAGTYDSPLFVELFGGFVEIVRCFGGASALRKDLGRVIQQLYLSPDIRING
ncbi:DEAD/DEAH box helicase family protein [Pectobacterium brasiliense]|uniref:type I restriction endonuclease subunit R n=1 Tax=Pectobacterium brasiliense TaxID=180957 RepID=UPI001D0D4D64|nr:type I restriction endonuclease subunit R [Pectobacterium brasiliense]UDQ77943.1 DEAD/DEAH box helicase family protein [Pectobacterium brasiliense]